MKTRTSTLFSIALIVLTTLYSVSSLAQTPKFREWWRQKKTNREYMAKQIALLQVQLELVKKGVKIVSAGLNTYQNIADGNFNLSRDFFSSLKNVKPAIARSARVADIIAFQTTLIKEFGKVRRFCSNNPNLSPTEVRYILAVYSNLVTLSDMNAAELLSLTRSGDTEMSDDERIVRIDKLHAQANEQLTFARMFSSELTALSLQRSADQRQTETSRKLNALI